MGKLIVKNRYGVVPNEILNSELLSFKAKGLYAYIQSKHDDWAFSSERISNQTKEGRDGVRAGLKELEDARLLQRIPVKDPESRKIVGYDYILHDIPFENHYLIPDAIDGKTVDGKAVNGLAADGNTVDGKHVPISNKEYSKQDISKKEKENFKGENKKIELKSKKSSPVKTTPKPKPPVAPPPLITFTPEKKSVREYVYAIYDLNFSELPDENKCEPMHFDEWRQLIDKIDKDHPDLWGCARIFFPQEIQLMREFGFNKGNWDFILTQICGSGVLKQHNLYARIKQFVQTNKRKDGQHFTGNGKPTAVATDYSRTDRTWVPI